MVISAIIRIFIAVRSVILAIAITIAVTRPVQSTRRHHKKKQQVAVSTDEIIVASEAEAEAVTEATYPSKKITRVDCRNALEYLTET